MMAARFSDNGRRVDADTALQLASRTQQNGHSIAVMLAILQNTHTLENTAPIGPSATPSFSSAAFTTTAAGAGKVQIRAMIGVTGVGGTSVAAEEVHFSLLRDGVALSASPVIPATLGATNIDAAGTFVWEDTTTPGSTHTYGVTAANITTPAHTLTIGTDQAVVQLDEAFN